MVYVTSSLLLLRCLCDVYVTSSLLLLRCLCDVYVTSSLLLLRYMCGVYVTSSLLLLGYLWCFSFVRTAVEPRRGAWGVCWRCSTCWRTCHHPSAPEGASEVSLL